ncbi:MAG: chorismate mutase [Planctomycetes bacterium]|nr:chorismate mutase [Planctomycetota bacterium]
MSRSRARVRPAKAGAAAQKLTDLRRAIDRLDEKIVDLLNERAQVVAEIGHVKQRSNRPAYAPDRERQVFERLRRRNRGQLTNDTLEAIYRELMSGSLALERQTRVAFLGPPGTFTHLAARERFGGSVEYAPARDVVEVFSLVSSKQADYGLVPLESRLGSGLTVTLDLFLRYPVKICAEILRPVRLCLMGKGPLEKIARIYSHPHAFLQSQRFLYSHFRDAERIETASTTLAAQLAAKRRGAAAIGSEEAASLYGLSVLAREIEDEANNLVRFAVLAREFGGPTGNDKTSIVLSAKDRVGALADILAHFRRAGVSVRRIESRPAPGRPGDASFFLDLEGHVQDRRLQTALAKVKRLSTAYLLLGSYPAGKETHS